MKQISTGKQGWYASSPRRKPKQLRRVRAILKADIERSVESERNFDKKLTLAESEGLFMILGKQQSDISDRTGKILMRGTQDFVPPEVKRPP